MNVFPLGRYVLANHALRDKKVILFYFAARSGAKDFAPHLREAYEVRKEEINGINLTYLLDAGQQSGRWRWWCGGRPGLRRKTIIVFQQWLFLTPLLSLPRMSVRRSRSGFSRR